MTNYAVNCAFLFFTEVETITAFYVSSSNKDKTLPGLCADGGYDQFSDYRHSLAVGRHLTKPFMLTL